ncbi:MAG: DUF3575 domain-containing protein [Bacteroidales bacterium]|nr:DUF3575 domain-containing protein [Bacteroidales bacterium]
MRRILLAAALIFVGTVCSAQQFAVGTNVLDYADLGTLNIEGSASVARRWTLVAAARYNPFLYQAEEGPVSARQQVYAAGVRYWPWHVYSGWWLGTVLQYQEYNRGGIRSPETDEGDRYGAGFSVGFSYMLHPHVNLEAGLGFWGGYDRYVTYSCPVCGLTRAAGERFFLLPNDLKLALLYVF